MLGILVRKGNSGKHFGSEGEEQWRDEEGACLQTHPQMQTRMLSEPTITHSETRLLMTTRMVRIRLRMTSVAATPHPWPLQCKCWL